MVLVVKNPPDNAEGLIPEFRRPLEEEMATHSRILAWKTPWMEKPGRLQSTGLESVRQDSHSLNFYVMNDLANCEISNKVKTYSI